MENSEIKQVQITKFKYSEGNVKTDVLAVEEPLEIVIEHFRSGSRERKNVSITMRTPGKDKELALGFLFTEGILDSMDAVETCKSEDENSVCISYKSDAVPDLGKLERHFYTSSSCGVCGKSSIESLRTVKSGYRIEIGNTIEPDTLYKLNSKVKEVQEIFESTGGLHASALFSFKGELLGLFEDVGRHNALDKLIGSALLQKRLPYADHILFLSGRACYELIQKAAMAGIPVICALGAPSSLAVELAEECNITLVGFLKDSSFNVYSGLERIAVKKTI